MKLEFAGDTAYGWQAGDSDDRDKGVIRLNGGAIQDININMGFGQSNSTCSVTVIEEEDGTFSEPPIGAPVRVAIPNSTGGDPDLFDQYNDDYSLAFIGLVNAINNSSDTSGKRTTVELIDTKEILKNIPIMLNRVTSNVESTITSIPNVVYAYEKNSRNEKGLKISSIWDAISGELFHYFGHSYYIDMSYMFGSRSSNVVSNGSFLGSIDNTGVINFKEGYDDGDKYLKSLEMEFGANGFLGYMERDDNWGFRDFYDNNSSVSDDKYICSPDFRIQGESRNLLDIIDEAMTKNGCDWYVRANSFLEYSLECKVVSGPVIIEIIPIQRNSFNQFTESDFNKFIGRLYGVESSKTFGRELSNQISNKIIFGSKVETMQKAKVKSDFKQFWGFKKDITNIRDRDRTIVDSYGNEIRAVSAINENPTFDTTSLDFLSESFYEFDLSDRFTKYLFYLLANTYTEKKVFINMMFCFYIFVKNYDDNINYLNQDIKYAIKTSKEGNKTTVESGIDASIFISNNFLYINYSYNTLETGIYITKNIKEELILDGINKFKKPTVYYQAENANEYDKNDLIYDGLHCAEIIITYEIYHPLGTWETKVVDHYKRYFTIRDGEIGESVDDIYEDIRNSNIYKWAVATKIYEIGPEGYKADSYELQSMQAMYKGIVGPSNKNLIKRFFSRTSERESILQNIDDLHRIVSSYLDDHLDKKFYKKIGEDAKWIPINEVWDGFDGYMIPNKFVRGKFMNKNNGKMPCLYRIENSEAVSFKENGKDVLFVTDEFDSSKTDVDVYGKAEVEVFATDRDMNSEEEDRYIIVSLNDIPIRTEKNDYTVPENSYDIEKPFGYSDWVDLQNATDKEKSFEAFLTKMIDMNFLFRTSGTTTSTMSFIRPTLRVVPDYFFIPTVHSYARYGPWILDSNTVTSNRSKYGTTIIDTDETLSPWQFRSYGDAQNYVLEQNKNALTTEYILNRGQVVAADIPRFNIGHRIGGFSNISSISIQYGSRGVSTTYTLTAFGVGQYTKEQRDKQEYLKGIRNVENKLENLSKEVLRNE